MAVAIGEALRCPGTAPNAGQLHLENRKAMKGKATKKVLKLIGELEQEGLL